MKQPIVVPVSELVDDLVKLRERADRHNSRWVLGLAIGNGGALAALASKALDKLDNPTIAIALPSLWFFAAGLILAGIAPMAETLRASGHIEKRRALLDEVQAAGATTVGRLPSAAGRSESLGFWALEVLSGLCFIAGLLYPLFLFTRRYLLTGSFIG